MQAGRGGGGGGEADVSVDTHKLAPRRHALSTHAPYMEAATSTRGGAGARAHAADSCTSWTWLRRTGGVTLTLSSDTRVAGECVRC